MTFWSRQREFEGETAVLEPESGLAFTYRRLFDDAERLAQRLALPGGAVALLLARNSYDSVCAYVGALLAGVPVMLADPRLSGPRLSALAERYAPEWILGAAPAVSSLVGAGYVAEAGFCGLSVLRREGGDEVPPHAELAALLSTSGSTGSAKYVRLSRRNLSANATSIIEFLKVAGEDRAITSLPMHYSYGLSVVNTHLQAGATLVCTEASVVERGFWTIFREQRCTTFAGVPYTYEMLRRLRFDGMDLPSLRQFTQAGGHLGRGTKAYFLDAARKKCCRFVVMYGQTEATARIAFVPPDRLGDKLDSIGVPIPGGTITLEEGGSVVTAPGGVGELVYRGPNVMLGYGGSRLSLAAGDELRGVLHTGDVARCDAEGFHTIVGRMNRFLKVYGSRVDLDELERLVTAALGTPVAAVGRDDCVVLVCEGAGEAAARRAVDIAAAETRLHRGAILGRACVAIPRSASGKIEYGALSALIPPAKA